MEKSLLRTLFTALRLIRHGCMRVILSQCGVDIVVITVCLGHESIQIGAQSTLI
jgi:hypothetical protein